MAEAQELGGLAMLQAMAKKIAAMRQTAHDHTMRQEGAAAAFSAFGKRLDQVFDASGHGDMQKLREQLHALLQNMHQAAIQQMTQQSGRALQASDILETCRALSAPSSEEQGAKNSR